ncbi:OmpA family protein [Candidatus Albibeggiatoa sp. nov. NOAA]|uniref:OmpA family protein n=1 Tax=Candidatus Albibeggiatoa sp. nov. NOAA TaxID=3162724 RepID=UPI0032F39F1A|nr:OmpA family protein [Thiotrichaceae bacterium]
MLKHYWAFGFILLATGCQFNPIQSKPDDSNIQQVKNLSVQQLAELSNVPMDTSPSELFSAMETLTQAEQTLFEAENLRNTEEVRYIDTLQKKKEQAALELQQAEQALQQARDLREAAEMEHLAYLAKRQSEIAARVAQRKREKVEQQQLLDKQLAFLQEVNRLQDELLGEQLQVAKQNSERLQNELTELKSQQTERGLELSFGEAFFDLDASELPDDVLRNLDKVAEFLQSRSIYKVLVESHTDNTGEEAYNLNLSQRRADFVRSKLIERGIHPSRVLAKGYGESWPVASNATEAGRQQNRRVEVIILNRSDDEFSKQ